MKGALVARYPQTDLNQLDVNEHPILTYGIEDPMTRKLRRRGEQHWAWGCPHGTE